MIRLKYIIVCLLFALNSFAVEFPDRPNPPHLVNDFAGLLSDAQKQKLERKLTAYNDTTSTEIAVVTVTTIEGYDVHAYNTALGNLWGIGKKDKDNGVVILIAKTEREVSIATGYGIERILTNAACEQIIAEDMVPNFKKGDIYAGLEQATNTIMGIASGNFTGSITETIDETVNTLADYSSTSGDSANPWIEALAMIITIGIFLSPIALIVLLIVYFSRRRTNSTTTSFSNTGYSQDTYIERRPVFTTTSNWEPEPPRTEYRSSSLFSSRPSSSSSSSSSYRSSSSSSSSSSSRSSSSSGSSSSRSSSGSGSSSTFSGGKFGGSGASGKW